MLNLYAGRTGICAIAQKNLYLYACFKLSNERLVIPKTIPEMVDVPI